MSNTYSWDILVDIHNDDEAFSFINKIMRQLNSSYIESINVSCDDPDFLLQKYALIRPLFKQIIGNSFDTTNPGEGLIQDLIKNQEEIIHRGKWGTEELMGFSIDGYAKSNLFERRLNTNLLLYHNSPEKLHEFQMEIRLRDSKWWSDENFLNRCISFYTEVLSRLNIPLHPILKVSSNNNTIKYIDMEIIPTGNIDFKLKRTSGGFRVGFKDPLIPLKLFSKVYSEYILSIKKLEFWTPTPQMMKWIHPRLYTNGQWTFFRLYGLCVGYDDILKELIDFNKYLHKNPQKEDDKKYYRLQIDWSLGSIRNFEPEWAMVGDKNRPYDNCLVLTLSKYNNDISSVTYHLSLETRDSTIANDGFSLESIIKKLNIKLGEVDIF